MSESSKATPPHRKKFLVGAALVIVLAGSAWFFSLRNSADRDLEDSGLLYEVAWEPFLVTINESGTIESRNRVVVKSEVAGMQTIIYLIPEGTMVEKGDLLIELDSSELEDKLIEEQIELENAEAELISSRENLEVVKNQAEADIAQARLDYRFAQQDLEKYPVGEYAMSLKKAISKITLAQAELQQAEDRLSGSKELFENQYISETEFESDQLAMQRAKMDLELAEQEKELLETFEYDRQIAQLESDVEQARLALEREERKARANIAEAEARFSARRAKVQREQVSTKTLTERIANCKIVAPTAGMVVYAPQGNRWNAEVLEEGYQVRERQELIYLPTASQMSAKVSVHESMLNKVEIGQTATIKVDALPGRVFTGEVREIAVMPEDGGWRNPDLKQYTTTISINEVSPDLRSGMTCNAEILVARFDEALTVPLQSVLRVRGKPTVFLEGPDGTVAPVVVRTGVDNNRKIQITDGLSQGSRILLNPPLIAAERNIADADADSGPREPAQAGVRPERQRTGTGATADRRSSDVQVRLSQRFSSGTSRE